MTGAIRGVKNELWDHIILTRCCFNGTEGGYLPGYIQWKTSYQYTRCIKPANTMYQSVSVILGLPCQPTMGDSGRDLICQQHIWVRILHHKQDGSFRMGGEYCITKGPVTSTQGLGKDRWLYVTINLGQIISFLAASYTRGHKHLEKLERGTCIFPERSLFLHYIGGQLIYNAVLVSAVRHSDSVIHIRTCNLFRVLFPYRLLQNIE